MSAYLYVIICLLAVVCALIFALVGAMDERRKLADAVRWAGDRLTYGDRIELFRLAFGEKK